MPSLITSRQGHYCLMTERKYSSLGFELRAGSVDPSLPLLFQIGVADGVNSEMQIIYVRDEPGRCHWPIW